MLEGLVKERNTVSNVSIKKRFSIFVSITSKREKRGQ